MDTVKKLHIGGALVTCVLGTLLHFVWEWSGRNPLAALFGAVSESTWEHLKLLFMPVLFCIPVEYFAYGRRRLRFFPAKALAVLAGMGAIVAAFYTYTGVAGDHFLVLDIGTFFLGVLVNWGLSWRWLREPRPCAAGFRVLGGAALALVTFLFWGFTFRPPRFGMFLPPK